jgi:hypothetical protein
MSEFTRVGADTFATVRSIGADTFAAEFATAVDSEADRLASRVRAQVLHIELPSAPNSALWREAQVANAARLATRECQRSPGGRIAAPIAALGIAAGWYRARRARRRVVQLGDCAQS